MKYEAANRNKPGMLHRSMGFMRRSPDTYMAAKAGAPQMSNPKQNIPVSVPTPNATGGFEGDIVAAPVTDSSALDNNPDARSKTPDGTAAAAADSTTTTPADTTKNGKKKANKKDKKATQ
jgi:hypothetical protein